MNLTGWRENEPTVAEAVRLVRARLRRGAAFETDRMAEWIVGHVLSIGQSELLIRAEERLSSRAVSAMESIVDRVNAGEPFAYVVGRADFLDLQLLVGPGVLIPRPETEGLAEWAIRRTPTTGRPVVLDVGTGAGPLALSIASARPNAEVHATDCSSIALEFASSNAKRLHLSQSIVFHQADLLPERPERFDVVVANLPYVGLDEIALVAPDVVLHEPHTALFAGQDGLLEIGRLLERLPARLAAKAAIGLEIGWRQGPAVVRMARTALPTARVHLRTDLTGRARYVLIEVERMAGSGGDQGERAG